MTLAWDGKYRFEKGDVVKVKRGHPWARRKGVVDSAMGSNQFGVQLTPTWIYAVRDITFWGDDLELINSGRRPLRE